MIDELIAMLASHALDTKFAPYAHNVADRLPWTETDRWPYLGQVRFCGNFEEVSHAFSIVTDEPETIVRLMNAIRGNVAYRAWRK